MVTRTAAEQFDADEQLAAESLAEELGIKDAGSWQEYVALRDGQRRTDKERSAA